MAVCSIGFSGGGGGGGGVGGQKCSCSPCPPNRGNSPLSTKDLWETQYLVAGTQS